MSKLLDEIAVELHLVHAEAELRQISFGVDLAARRACQERSELEQIARRIGLSEDATASVLDSYATRAALLYKGHLIIRAQDPEFVADLKKAAGQLWLPPSLTAKPPPATVLIGGAAHV
jgi:hypothetical protein